MDDLKTIALFIQYPSHTDPFKDTIMYISQIFTGLMLASRSLAHPVPDVSNVPTYFNRTVIDIEAIRNKPPPNGVDPDGWSGGLDMIILVFSCISGCPDGQIYYSCQTYIRDPCEGHLLPPPQCTSFDDYKCLCSCPYFGSVFIANINYA